MSDADAALYGGLGGGIAGGILAVMGVLLGLFAERILQRYGKLRCETAQFALQLVSDEDVWDLSPQGMNTDWIAEAQWVSYKFNIKFFNEKDARTGLRDVRVVFYGNGGRHIRAPAFDAATFQVHRAAPYDRIEVIPLPSREWVSLDVRGSLLEQDKDALPECHRAEFVGYFPTGREFRKEIARLSKASRNRTDGRTTSH
jgi:hypothetical protein